MRKLLVLLLISFCQFTMAAENELLPQDAETDEAQIEAGSNENTPDDGSDLIIADIAETNDAEEEASVRFIPTEEISQDLGVSFPIDI